MSSSGNTQNHWPHKVGQWGFLCLFVIWGAVMAPKISNIAGGADPSCYLELNRLFMRGELSPPLRPVASLPLETFAPNLYAPISYEPKADYSGLIPTGFTGTSLFYSLFDLFLPTPWAVTVAIWLAMMGCGGLTYLLLRELGFGAAWACLGGIAMLLSPLTVFIGSIPLSDTLTCSLALLSWWLALRASRGFAWSFALGFVLGWAVLTRAPNVIAFVPIAVALLLGEPRKIKWVAICLGGLPAAIFLVTYNLHVHGSLFLTTGYTNAPSLFVKKQFWASLLHDAKWLPVLCFPVAVAPLALLWFRAERRVVLTCAAWVFTYIGFYAFYFASSENWYILRYIMPAMAALLVAAILVLARIEGLITHRFGLGRWVGVLPLLLATGGVGYDIWQCRQMHVFDFKRNESNILEVVKWIDEGTTRNDVFLCFQFSGSIHYYTDRSFLRQERVSANDWQKLIAATRHGPAVYGIFYVFEYSTAEAVAARFPGKWQEEFKTNDSIIRVFRLVEPPPPQA